MVTLDSRLAERRRPDRPPVMYQTWKDLLFLHWEVEPSVIQATLPSGLQVDTHDGRAYLGIVPFKMRRIRPRGLPAVPGISNFLELNLRTYVHHEGRPGVWFYSLDASSAPAVFLARRFFSLPYHRARMRAGGDGTGLNYGSLRRSRREVGETVFRFASTGPARPAEPGSLDFFLVERYVLFAIRKRRPVAGRVHHQPYPLRSARVEAWDTRLLELNGFPARKDPPAHVVASPGVDVEIFPLGT